MKDIFVTGIFPTSGKIKEHFRDFYDSIFIAYLPFFKMLNTHQSICEFKGSREASLEVAQNEDSLLERLENGPYKSIYLSNQDYPTNEEIMNLGSSVSWKTVAQKVGFKNSGEVNAALKTSIGAYKKAYSRPDLEKRLCDLTTHEKIWHPIEGAYSPLAKKAIYRTLFSLGKREIRIQEEFKRRDDIFLLDESNESEFCRRVGSKDYHIFSTDKDILFTIDWDDFFFLIAAQSDTMTRVLGLDLFEGFLCDENTEHSWEQ